jgi:subtilin biosynthesis protein spaC
MEIEKIKQICHKITNIRIRNDKISKNDITLLTLSDGLPGILLLISELDLIFPSENWNEKGNRFVGDIVSLIEKVGIYNFSMYSGTAGLGLSINSLSKNGKYYKELTRDINSLLMYQLDNYFKNINVEDVSIIDYDIISGLSGVVSYMLLYKQNYDMIKYLEKSIDLLIALTRNKVICELEVMRLFVRSEKQMTLEESKLVPYGALNTSLSHGIAGVGVALAMAYFEGIIREGHEIALKNIIDFFEKYKRNAGRKVYWDTHITPDVIVGAAEEKKLHFRDAWCYGAPGISIFYLYTGLALKNERYINISKSILLNSLNSIMGIYSPILCHGYAGLLEIVRTFYIFTNDPIFNKHLNCLLKRIKEYFSCEYRFGFANFEYCGDKRNIEQKEGFLCGSAGIILSLLGSQYGIKTSWKRALMLY